MRRGLLVLLLVLAACGPSKPPGEPHPKIPPIGERYAQQVATSRIERLGERELTLARPGKPLRVEVNAGTTVFLGGQVVGVRELRPGMRVRVSYDAMLGAPRANWIQVLPEPRGNSSAPDSGI